MLEFTLAIVAVLAIMSPDLVRAPFHAMERLLDQRRRLKDLRRENRRLREALGLYAAPENWIGDAYVRTEDPSAPARLALQGEPESRIKALPPKYPGSA